MVWRVRDDDGDDGARARRRRESIPGRDLSSFGDHVRTRGVGEASQAGLDRRGGQGKRVPA